MKKILKWVGIVLGVLIVVAFFGFLYFIPPFTLAPPEEFSNPVALSGPSLDDVTDPVERGGKSDQAVPRDAAVGGHHGRNATKSPGLADGAARICSEGSHREVGRHRRC